MTEPTPDWLDIAALGAALERVPSTHTPPRSDLPDLSASNPLDLGGVTMLDVVWATRSGPQNPAIGRAILASPRASRLARNLWEQKCPTAEVIDAAVASPTATPAERDLAHATHQLLTFLHTTTCEQCRDRLKALSRGVRAMEDPDVMVRRWTFYATPTTAMAGVRGRATVTTDGASPTGATFVLDNSELCDELVAVRMVNPQDVTLEVELQEATQNATVTLIVPGGIAPTVRSVTVYLTTTEGQIPVPLDLSPRADDDVVFLGSVQLAPDTTLTLGSIDIEVN